MPSNDNSNPSEHPSLETIVGSLSPAELVVAIRARVGPSIIADRLAAYQHEHNPEAPLQRITVDAFATYGAAPSPRNLLSSLIQRAAPSISEPKTIRTLRIFYQSHILNRESITPETMTEFAHLIRLADHAAMTFNAEGVLENATDSPLSTLLSTLKGQLKALKPSPLTAEALTLQLAKDAVMKTPMIGSTLDNMLHYAKAHAPLLSWLRTPPITNLLDLIIITYPNLNGFAEMSSIDRDDCLVALTDMEKPQDPHLSLLYETLILECKPDMIDIVNFSRRRNDLRSNPRGDLSSQGDFNLAEGVPQVTQMLSATARLRDMQAEREALLTSLPSAPQQPEGSPGQDSVLTPPATTNTAESSQGRERNPVQSAHGTVVHEDIVKGLNTLHDLYSATTSEDDTVETTIQAMRDWLDAFDTESLGTEDRDSPVQHVLATSQDPQAYLTAAKATFNRFRGTMRDQTYRDFSQANYREILTLVWRAIHDNERCQGTLPMRQESLLRTLHNIDQSYTVGDEAVDAGNTQSGNEACTQGHMAILIAGLNSMHNEIDIRFMSGKIVLDSARWYAQSAAIKHIEGLMKDNNQILKAETTLKQCYNSAVGIADTLAQETKEAVRARLQQEFQVYFNTPATDTRFDFDNKVTLDEAMECYDVATLSDEQVTNLLFMLVKSEVSQHTDDALTARVHRLLELNQDSLNGSLREARNNVAEVVLTRCRELKGENEPEAGPSTPGAFRP
ncbi:MAG: hypothetical protein DHS20C10_11430 [marine bacterium B5-7]|nr:MAG: hypothetical protein DHS20C10_11430 [marine bacterium B5-7]